MGKGLAGMRSLQRKHRLDGRSRIAVPTSLKGIAGMGRDALKVKASMPEEPGAVVPHAGILRGGRRVTGGSTSIPFFP